MKRGLALFLSVFMLVCTVSTNVMATPVEFNGVSGNSVSDNNVLGSSISDNNVSVTDESVSENGTTAEEKVLEEWAEEELVTEDKLGIGLESVTTNYLVDKIPDENGKFDGNYLVVVNDFGTVASSEIQKDMIALEADEPENSVYGYDPIGIELIDPASILPELSIGNGIRVDTDTVTQGNIQPEKTVVGTVGRKNLMSTESKEKFISTSCICMAIGEYCTVWVPSLDPIVVNQGAAAMKEYMQQIADEFDARYPDMVNMFGSNTYIDENGGDADGKVAIYCYDIMGDGAASSDAYTAGFFYGADLDLNFTSKTGNNEDCIHIDSYQGMRRNTSTNTLGDPLHSKGTLVHEFQHLINFSICREKESSFYSIITPDWLNEMYSAAAQHLCYGPSEGSGRITTYNTSDEIPRGYPLAYWTGALENYALVYLFGQYIRIQYEQLGYDGETIYKDAMNAMTASNTDLLAIIADKLDTTSEELLLDFRIALQLKNADGRYGFGSESWAESISSDRYYEGNGNYLAYYGAGLVAENTETYIGDGLADTFGCAGVFTTVAETDVTVTITGGDSISQMEGTLQLYASVAPASAPQTVTWSITAGSENATINTSTGLVTAVQDGTVTVRATSVAVPSKYAEKTITITGQTGVKIAKSESIYMGGRWIKYTAANPVDAKLYYTLNGNTPTTLDMEFPVEGLTFTVAGIYNIKVLGHDESGEYADSYIEETIEMEKVSEPTIVVDEAASDTVTAKKVTMYADNNATIFYTLDGTVPTASSTQYEGPFTVETVGETQVNAIAMETGAENSSVSSVTLSVCLKATGVSLDVDDFVLYTNLTDAEKAKTITATVLPEELSDAVVYWESSNESVATVGDGIVTAVGVGSAVITASVDDVSAQATVTVSTAAERIAVTNSTLSITKDSGSLALKTTVLPQGAVNNALNYSIESSDREGDVKGIATITDEGVIRAIKNGVVKVTITTEDAPGIEGSAISVSEYVTLSGQVSYEREYCPKVVETSFTMNKWDIEGQRLTVLPLGETEVTSVQVKENSQYAEWFEITKESEKNEWSLAITEEGRNWLTNTTHKIPITAETIDEFEIILNVKVVNTAPTVRISTITMNPNYPNREYTVNATSTWGNVAVVGIKDGSKEGFTDNFTYDSVNNVITAAKVYTDFLVDRNGKKVLSGYLTVQVAGYQEQDVPITIRVSNAKPKLSTANKTYQLNYTKLNLDKSVSVQILENKNILSTISNVTLNQNAGKNYEKVKNIVEVSVDDGNVKINFIEDSVASGTYLVPLLIDSHNEADNRNDFAMATCNVKIVVKKNTQMPTVKLHTKSVKLNKQLPEEVATISIQSIDQNNANLLDFYIVPATAKAKSNVDDKVTLNYNDTTGKLEAKMTGAPGCNKYVFKCTPIFEDINENGEVVIEPISITVTLINKAYSVKTTSRGSIDVLNRDSKCITYIVKKTNFADEISDVEMVAIADETDYDDTLLDAREYFEEPVLNSDGTVTVKLQSDAEITKKCKYAFRLQFTLANSGETVTSKDINIIPKQSGVRLSQSCNPVFYDKVGTGSNVEKVRLSANTGIIGSVEYNISSNEKLPEAFDVLIDENGQLEAVFFDGTKGVKRGTYTIILDVYYKGQMWEKQTANTESYLKPATYKLKVQVK